MNIWEIDKLLVFIAFVIPGFIALKTYELLDPGDPKSSSQQIIDAIAYSCIYYFVLFTLMVLGDIVLVWFGKESSWFYEEGYDIFILVVLFLVVLVALPCLWLWIRKRKWIQKFLPHPTQKPWDYVFSQRKRYWITVTLKDGTKITGRYDDESFASSAPSEEQIYLEKTWILNDDKWEEQPTSIIILSDIAYIELMKYKPEEDDHEE